MSKLIDSLLREEKKDKTNITVVVDKDFAKSLTVIAEKLGISRAKLVTTLFEAGWEMLEKKDPELTDGAKK